MSTAHFTFCTLFSLTVAAMPVTAFASDGPLRPFKDELFSAQTVLSTGDGGASEVIDYKEMRDINGRDEVPERRVKRQYVDMAPKKVQALETVTFAGRALEVGRVGPASGQAFTIIFIHGRGGDRRLGMNDYTFGGNFNRLKNLAVANGGTYYVPSVRSFDENGVADIAALIADAARKSGGKPVILTCASMGSFICYGISRDKAAVANLKGMAILGGAVDPDFPKSAFAKAKKPVWFTHGSADKVYSADQQATIFRTLLKAGEPARFTRYETGSHGTPVRMTDWRAVLNWILSR
ncbi:dienelactone hydrolase family protein [Agrobacterium pusense]|uniref:dienelactone hydrolase family protein n=1 Tax=Agrobacterium pusense TaxID=648995 RepID=UPI0022B90115|nr:dienelactone hydrolase family protein [Agrobacterium pusense]MCZ7926812.1 dienelactone hydrolase family protein [Agrobacterium pusense]